MEERDGDYLDLAFSDGRSEAFPVTLPVVIFDT